MKVYKNKSDCSGCSACFSICPVNAITMAADSEGFLYPEVDDTKCVSCNRCLSVCPIKIHHIERDKQNSLPHIGIINLQNTSNYGASIAAAVLEMNVRDISGSKYVVETIDYNGKYRGNIINKVLDYVEQNNGWINCFKGAYRRLFKEDKALSSDLRNIRKERFASFNEKFLNRTIEYNDAADINSDKNNYAFIVGSDVVWHPKRVTNFRSEAYFLKFAGKDTRKISYAASVDIKSDYLNNYKSTYSDGLKNIDYISVREKDTSDYLSELTDNNISVECDPAFLFTSEQYNEMIEFSSEKPDEDYIYLYLLDRNDFLIEYAKKLSKEKGLKLYYFTPKYPAFDENSHNCLSDGPAEFLMRVKNSRYILSNSFHCIVFSLIFEKKFLSFDRSKSSIKGYNLLSQFNLTERIVNSDSVIDIDKPIDFDSVRQKISEMRNDGLQFLKNSLQ